MNPLSIYWAEFRHEVRAGMRGPLFPIAAIGFTLYVLIVITNGNVLRGFGAMRNSSAIIYQFATFMSIYMFFVWAWVFAQVVVRDRNVNLQENVLSSPISLDKLLFARYLGASFVAFLIGSVIPLSFLLMPIPAWLGMVPPETIGVAPVLPVLLSMFLFVLPAVLGMGALFVSSAIWTRSTVGPFVVAAFLMLIWMLGFLVFNEADINDTMAALLDPTLFTEVDQQIDVLTPDEKNDFLLAVTLPYLLNRLLWFVLPVGLLLFVLRRLKRDDLLLGNSKKMVRDTALKQTSLAVQTREPVTISDKPSWPSALLSEALWHLRLSLQNKGLLLALVILLIMGVGGSIMSVLQNGQGPMVPHVEHLLSNGGFFSLFTLLALAGFVGALMRRDQRSGFDEMFDATPAPFSTRVVARILSAFFFTVALGLFPVLTIWIVMAIGGMAIAWWDPLAYTILVDVPALLEISALAVLSHSLIRNAGAAYGVSMMLAFMAFMNHELLLISYPPAQISKSVSISFSSIDSWQPWLSSIISTDLFKLGISLVIVSLAWLLWPRGVDFGFAKRWQMARSRIYSVAPMAIAGLLLITISGTVLYQKLVVHGEYQSLKNEIAENAAWEKQWWHKANAYSLDGGKVHVKVNPSKRAFTAVWTLNNVKTAKGLLHGNIPHGVEISSAMVEGREVVIDTAYDHFALPLENCPPDGCAVKMTLTAELQGWSADKVQSWLLPSGVWLRAVDVLPTLGVNPDRRLHIPSERAEFGLSELSNNLHRHAMQSTDAAVAPKGSWHWRVEVEDNGVGTQTSGSLNGPLDFAMVWLPDTPKQTTHNGIEAWHGDEYGQAAKDIIEDVQLMAQCVGDLLGQVPTIRNIIQSPRELGEIKQYGELLWLPENLGWDIDSEGPGRKRRRAAIATALSRNVLLQATNLRTEAGAQWLLSGVSGWVGMECMRRSDGQEAWIAEQDWQASELSKAMGERRDVPIGSVSDASESDWIKPYTALSILNWASIQGTEQTVVIIKSLLKRLQNDEPLPKALAAVAGQQTADSLLGMPMVSDIALHVDDKQQAQITAQRWQWHNNGWQLIKPPLEVLQLAGKKTQLLDLQKSAEINTAQDFIVLDSRPSVERTPKDNVWRHAAKH